MVRYLAVVVLMLYALYTGPANVLREGGFAVGMALGIFPLVLVSYRHSSLKIVTTLISLILVLMVPLSQLAFHEDRAGFAYGVGVLYFGLLTLAFISLVLVLIGYLLRRGILGGVRPCRVLFLAYAIPLIFIGLANFLLFSVLTPLFLPNYSVSIGFLAFQIVTWLIILGLSVRIDDDALVQPIRERGLGQIDVKREVIAAFGVFLILGTLFEALRGLWTLWLGFALLLTLMSLSLWKMLKHVLTVPASPTTEQLSPSDP